MNDDLADGKINNSFGSHQHRNSQKSESVAGKQWMDDWLACCLAVSVHATEVERQPPFILLDHSKGSFVKCFN